MWSCGCSFTTFFLFLGTCSWTWTWVPGYLGTWVPGYLGTWVPGYLGTWAPGCACRTPGSGSRTQGSDCESDSRTPESDCRTQGVRLSDPLGLRQKGPTFPGQTAPCGLGKIFCLFLSFFERKKKNQDFQDFCLFFSGSLEIFEIFEKS